MNDDMLTIGQAAGLLNRTEDVIRSLVDAGLLAGESGPDSEMVVSRDAILAYQSDERAQQLSSKRTSRETIDDVVLESEVIEGKRRGQAFHAHGIA